MQITNFDSQYKQIGILGAYRKGKRDVKRRFADTSKTENQKNLCMSEDLWSYLYSNYGVLWADSSIIRNTEFLPMIIDGKYLIDTNERMYTMKRNNYVDSIGYRRQVSIISPIYCTAHYKKEPHLCYLEGVMICNRCKRLYDFASAEA